MNRLFKVGAYFISIILLVSCGTNKIVTENKGVNTKLNSKYKKSRKTYYGSLNKTEYRELMNKLETEFKTTIPNGKSILVNFTQKAPNCISVQFSKKRNELLTSNSIRISWRISSNNNVTDFFVYTKDSYHRDIFEKLSEFILDSGFFHENVFTEHENCEGFLLVKPTGEFYKYYGEDYYSKIQEFLN